MAKSIPEVKIGNEVYQIKDRTAREHLVEVSTTQPTSEDNKLWINNQENEYEVPTMDEFNGLKSAIRCYAGINIPEYTTTVGYIKIDMTITSSASYRYSSPIPVHKGDRVYFTATGYDNISMITKCDSDYSNREMLVKGIDGNEHDYYCSIDFDGYIAISYDERHDVKICIVSVDASVQLSEQLYKIIDLNSANYTESDGYVKVDLTTTTSTSFSHSSPIYIKANSYVSFNCSVRSNTVSVITECTPEGTPIKVLVAGIVDDSSGHDYNILIGWDTYIIISWEKRYTPELTLRNPEDVYALAKTNTEYRFNYATIGLFTEWAVIGDSWSVGAIHTTEASEDDDETVVNNIDLSWEKILARRTGTNAEYYATGGMTTQNWLNASGWYHDAGVGKFDLDDPKQLYVIKLGINDAYSIYTGAYTIGTPSDINTSDLTQSADTFMGNLAHIIGLLKIKSPNGKIVVLGMADNVNYPNGYQKYSINKAMEQTAKICEVAYIGEYEDSFFQSDFFKNGLQGKHPTAVVLSGMAMAIDRLFSSCVNQNYAYFKGFYWEHE